MVVEAIVLASKATPAGVVRGATRSRAPSGEVAAVLDAIAEDVPAETMERVRQVAIRFPQ